MIIDVHYHFLPTIQSEEVARAMAERHVAFAHRAGIKKTADELWPTYLEFGNDPHGEKLLRRMDKLGIDVTVACIVDNVDMGNGYERVLEINKACAQLGREHPQKLIPLAGIDPRSLSE